MMTTDAKSEARNGLLFSLRTERPMVIECPDGQRIELYQATGKNVHRTVRLVLPSGYFAHKGNHDVGAQA